MYSYPTKIKFEMTKELSKTRDYLPALVSPKVSHATFKITHRNAASSVCDKQSTVLLSPRPNHDISNIIVEHHRGETLYEESPKSPK